MSQYATIEQFWQFGLPQTARGQLSDAEINAALVSASATCDGYFRGRYGDGSVPLVAWGEEVSTWVCWIAAYNLMTGPRGYNSAASADTNLRDRRDDAMTKLAETQRQAYHPTLTPGTAVNTTGTQPLILSSSVIDVASGRRAASRGW